MLHTLGPSNGNVAAPKQKLIRYPKRWLLFFQAASKTTVFSFEDCIVEVLLTLTLLYLEMYRTMI